MMARGLQKDAALRPQPKRHGADVWPTPVSLTDALIIHVLPSLPEGIIWEPAAGDGGLATALRHAGRQVAASDLLSDGLDFLSDKPPTEDRFSAIITNPPFNRLDEFIARGLQLMDGGNTRSLAMLLRNDAMMASGRVEVLNRAALTLACNWRARWIPDSHGQPRWAFTWVNWRDDHPGPP